ncbi:MAG TPA: PIG-L family deacetylase [Bacteroidia bacterium]|nr:PIG-L family deacetylase [Bacteroidia bacterium]HNT81157.1 PIG-L family deacetylase [Bacteroidia bacterium]
MIFDAKKILILAPHPDDAEFGLGGTISKLIEQGKEIFVTTFSVCEKSTPKGFEVGDIEKEMYASMNSLNIKKECLTVYDYPVRDFPAHRQEILEKMIEQKKRIEPDLVFIPCSSDIHQDHEVINVEGKRAFKHHNLLGYEMPWNNFGFTSFLYHTIEEKHLKNKLKAIACYKSQIQRAYSTPEFITALATLRGGQILKPYAESFEVIRLISK